MAPAQSLCGAPTAHNLLSMQPSYFERLSRAYLIAEIGVNHNGNPTLARELVVAAKRAGADAVKFQTFTAASLVTPGTPKVEYQTRTSSPDESHHDMLERLELSEVAHRDLFAFCAATEIEFLSTPYDIESARFLATLGVTQFKTASADLVDLPLQDFIASTRIPAIVATGMASLGEVEQAVNVYRHHGNADFVLLHCVSNYPCSDESLNLRAMRTLAAAFGAPVGFSDHSDGFLAAATSVALGAKVIEKHFTLDKTMPGPDHRASSTPEEFAELVANVRRAERILGSANKVPQAEEQQMAQVSRKSLVATRELRAGSLIQAGDVRLMRPGSGLPASAIPAIVGRRTTRDIAALERLHWRDVEGA